MKIAILHAHCGISSKRLANSLKENGHDVQIINANKDAYGSFAGFDSVFGYGCSSRSNGVKERINKPDAVKRCVNKIETFKAFNQAGVPTVEYCTDVDAIPEHWDQIVCRESMFGRKAQGIDYFFQGDDIPRNCELYTQTFYGRYEYRVVYFKGDVFVYFKRLVNDEWHFMIQPSKGFEQLISDTKKASESLGIDYVGYDVLAKNKASYVFLEANSGAILTDEAEAAIIKYYS